MCTNLNRRDVLKQSFAFGTLTGASSLMGNSKLFAGGEEGEAKYFLHIIVPFGVDASYLFDARPLQMTAEKTITNYHAKDPIPYTGINGQSTLRTSITDPLVRWKDYFTVINGVVMNTSFEGHDQAMNSMLTGNPFGGDFYVPWSNHRKNPIDYIQTEGFLFANISNSGASVKLSPAQAKQLGKRVQPLSRTDNPALHHMIIRADAAGKGAGSFSAASRRMADAIRGVPNLASRMTSLQMSEFKPIDNNTSMRDALLIETKSNIEMIAQMMNAGTTTAGVLVMNPRANTDTHDLESAKKLPEALSAVMEALAGVFDYLNSIPGPSGKGTMLSEMTILVGSEFSRTMKQTYQSFETSGTDHNPLTNTLIIAGRGVRGGQVIGKSDFNSSGEELSKAHLTFGAQKIKIMGMPFDSSTGNVIFDVKPETFDANKYLTINHVTNTVQQILGIPAEKRFTPGRNMPATPTIATLIT